MKIAKITGTKKAGENATVTQEGNIITVTWDSGELVKFEGIDNFKTWSSNNRFVASVEYTSNPKEVKTYKDMIVTRETVTRCGADWKEQLSRTGRAGHTETVVSVIRKHKDFEEVLINTDSLFRKAMEATSELGKS
jgi:hypothetical protein